MRRLVWSALASILACGAVGRADEPNGFSSNPLTDSRVLVRGPDAENASSRFSYDATAQTLTAHFDSTAPTVKLLFPLGRQVTQNDSFSFSTTFAIQSAGFISPQDFGAAVPSFGLVNSISTGSIRASTGHYDMDAGKYVEDYQGDAYDSMTLDYFPTQDNTYGGSSVSLTAIQSRQNGISFNSRFRFGYMGATLPLDQTITATIAYSAQTHVATMDWGTGQTSSDLTGAVFDLDSFAILLWNDPNLNPPLPSDPSGSPVGGDGGV